MIPKKIHQIWGMWDSGEMPEDYKRYSQTFKRCNPDYKYRLWTKREITNMIFQHYPRYIKFYRSLPSDVHRGDVARYFILHREGGIYADLDMECLKNLDNFVHEDFVLGMESFKRIEAPECCFMMSREGATEWLEVIGECEKNVKKTLNPFIGTGPFNLKVLEGRVKILDKEVFFPVEPTKKSVTRHHKTTSWAKNFNTLSKGAKVP